ncbi:restriction endonuclease [Priestia megaterium]|uniref:restriction endonuclease n=1 Tax=Priestia megaterium TaxID=1404 RepID=UPI000BEDB5E8|nr:restriction endonuclease [Priestia megaterium]PEA36884.1 restriction endonuclease [Priestia megaterium]PGX43247.1 restriction endonuclease [Priestia megaterium]
MDNFITSIGYFLLFVILFKGSLMLYQAIRTRKQHKALLKADMPYIDKMDGRQFEIYLQILFRHLGYQPEVTKQTGDFGADLVMKRDKKIVVQAKRYGYKNRVSLSVVQEVYGAKAYYRANQAWVVTNSYFTKQAKELAAACDVKLVDRRDLQELIRAINPTFEAKEIYENVTPETRKCPECGKQLVVRQGKGDRFFSCSSFPSCRHTEKINK